MAISKNLAPTSPYPIGLDIARAEGIYLIDKSGKKYMDMISGVGVSALGHGNERVKTALKAQIDQHLHVMVYGEYAQGVQNELAQKLCSLLPPTLDCAYFVNSGAEANETALKLVKRCTGRTKLVSCKKGYHGSTHGALSVSGNEVKKRPFRPLLPEVYFMDFNSMESLELIDTNTAGVILETIQGDAGVRIPDVAWMKALRKKCDETGALLILDEIQCGLGRAGTWWAFEQFGLVPDILTLGKALGAGLPIGACIASQSLLDQFSHDPVLGHITTFGGHPVICAGALAGLNELVDRKLIDDVNRKGKILFDALASHPQVKEIRYRGLFFAIDLESDEAVQAVVEDCMQAGVIGFYFLSHRTSFRLAPPFVITEDELRTAASIITKALDKL
jgi:acetylornithine/succinyldiaminopimelate/putrescine aminotransferase